MSKINAHRVFKGTTLKNGFLNNISVPLATTVSMRVRRDMIREYVRAGIQSWDERIEKRKLFEDTSLQFNAKPPALSPKFRMQGSQKYGTANDPATKPPQELDLDDGLFLPVTFFEKHGASTPLVASRGLFALVEEILKPFCRRHGWELITSKSSCIRIRFGDFTHYDLPLYAVSDKTYGQLLEKRMKAAANSVEFEAEAEKIELMDAFYDSFDREDIRLAHREKGWIDSDPRLLEQWFKNAVQIHGEQLRRVCRYIKSWRDYQWKECKLSSIALMACVVRAYDDLGGHVPQSRDDLALYEVSQRLPGLLNEVIENPVPGKPALNEDWDIHMRFEYVGRAKELRRKVSEAFEIRNSKMHVLKCFEFVFGSRIPDDENLITIEAMATQVKQYQPTKVRQPNVKRSTSG